MQHLNPLHPTVDLALLELERRRLVAELARPRRRPYQGPPTARLRARLNHLFHRDA